MRITSKGQVTIPIAIHQQSRLLPNTAVDFASDGKIVRIFPAKTKKNRGAKLAAHLRKRGDVSMSTGEIMALTRA